VTVHAPGYDSDRLYASIARLLEANALCSMATRSESGALHINMTYCCFNSDLVLYFLSHPESLHCRNLIRVPQMAVAVAASDQPWGDPHAGLQLHGRGEPASPDAEGEARELYGRRFPRYRDWPHRSSSFSALRFYSFMPERVQILDEWEFGEEVFIPVVILR
jgi:uncharacterized protein YhbP (UPF0306 family)